MVVGATACGKKGPPLAPLRLVPGPVSDVTVRRVGGEVRIHFKLPTANANGPGAVDLDHVEVYAVTAAPGTAIPANRDLLSKTYAVATIAVKPPPREGDAEPPAGTPPDPRPGPGDDVSFIEELTEARLKPAPLPKIPVPPGYAVLFAPVPALPAYTLIPGLMSVPESAAAACRPLPRCRPSLPAPPFRRLLLPPVRLRQVRRPAPAPGACTGAPAPGAPAPAAPAPTAPAAAPVQTTVVRVYVLRGMAKSGRPGQPSARLTVPIVNPPLPPSAPKATFTETTTTIAWTPPAPAGAEATPLAFNVYRLTPKPQAAAPPAGKPAAAPAVPVKPEAPVNPTPLTAAKLDLPGVTMGTEAVLRGPLGACRPDGGDRKRRESDGVRHANRRVPAGSAAERGTRAARRGDRAGLGRRVRARYRRVHCLARRRAG